MVRRGRGLDTSVAPLSCDGLRAGVKGRQKGGPGISYRAARVGRTAVGGGVPTGTQAVLYYQVCSVCPACGNTQMGELARELPVQVRPAGAVSRLEAEANSASLRTDRAPCLEPPRQHHDAPDDRTGQGLLVRRDGAGAEWPSRTCPANLYPWLGCHREPCGTPLCPPDSAPCDSRDHQSCILPWSRVF